MGKQPTSCINAIKSSGLTKMYGSNRGITDLNLTVERGDIFGFLGPNGAGKSTTIRSLLGLINFQAGNAEVLGFDVKTQKRDILKHVGYLPSEAMFYNGMKVKEVIKFAADMRGLDCKKQASKLCERLEVDLDKRIDELSLGNRKKVGIVCAMQHEPDLLIFDEPTSGLDPLMQAEFFKIVTEYNKNGTTCFLSSHILPEIKKYCRNAAIIKDGKLITADSVENLTKTNAKRIKITEDGTEREFVFKGNINELLAGFAEHDISDITIEEPELDEIFMHYYAEDGNS